MIQLLVALAVFGVGAFLLQRSIVADGENIGKAIAGILIGLAGVLWLGVLSIGLVGAHIGVDSDVTKYEQVKIAVRAARSGDPSYSGILMEAVQWNQAIAVSRKRIDSPWWGIYYSRQIADLELIEMPGDRK